MKIFSKRNGLTLPNQHGARLRFLVIVGTLLIASFIGLRPGSRLAMLPVLLVVGLLGLAALLRYLPWGVIAIVPISFLVDFRVGTGTNVALNAAFLFLFALIGVWLLRMIVVERHLRLVASPVNLPALLFIGAGLLSWLTSFLPWLPLATGRPSMAAQAGAFLIYALSIGAMLLAINTLTNQRLLETFTWFFIVFGIIYLLAQVVTWDFKFVIRWFVDAHYGSAAYWTLLSAMTLGQALFNRRLSHWIRGGLLITAVIVVAFGLLKRPEWISGWLPPIIAVGILIWLKNWRLGLLVTVFGTLLLIPTILNFYNTQVNTETQQWSSLTRFATWPIVLNLFKINPLTGLGPAVYPYLTSFFFYLGYYVTFNTHNNFFDIVLQMGLIGFGLFSWLVAVIYQQGWRLRLKSGDGFSQGYVNGVLAALTAILISGAFADWFLPFLYNIGIPGFQASVFLWLFCGGLLSLTLLKQEQSQNA